MNAEKIVKLTEQNPPNKYLALMSKTYLENATDSEGRQIKIEFVSKIINAIANKVSVTWIVIPFIAFIVTVVNFICYCYLMNIHTEFGVGLDLIPMSIFFVWSCVQFLSWKDQRLIISDDYHPIQLITFVEKILQKPVEEWSDGFNPVDEIEKGLRKLAQQIRDAEIQDESAPWKPKMAPEIRDLFNEILKRSYMIIPIEGCKEVYFKNNQRVAKLLKEAEPLAVSN